jgi:hypothetical protein
MAWYCQRRRVYYLDRSMQHTVSEDKSTMFYTEIVYNGHLLSSHIAINKLLDVFPAFLGVWDCRRELGSEVLDHKNYSNLLCTTMTNSTTTTPNSSVESPRNTSSETPMKEIFESSLPPSSLVIQQLYSPKVSLSPGLSLNEMMTGRSSLKAAHAAFVLNFEKRQPSKVTFEADYGYGKDFVEPQPKRRRFQRRNSKTPQMLMAMSAALLPLDFLEDEDNEHVKIQPKSTSLPLHDDDDDDDWDGGLEIAEELVMELQKRHCSNNSS